MMLVKLLAVVIAFIDKLVWNEYLALEIFINYGSIMSLESCLES